MTTIVPGVTVMEDPGTMSRARNGAILSLLACEKCFSFFGIIFGKFRIFFKKNFLYTLFVAYWQFIRKYLPHNETIFSCAFCLVS